MISELFSHLCQEVASKLANVSQLAWVLDCHCVSQKAQINPTPVCALNALNLRMDNLTSLNLLQSLQIEFMNPPTEGGRGGTNFRRILWISYCLSPISLSANPFGS